MLDRAKRMKTMNKENVRKHLISMLRPRREKSNRRKLTHRSLMGYSHPPLTATMKLESFLLVWLMK